MKINNLNELYGNTYYIYQYNRYQPQYKFIREDNKKPYLINEYSNEEIKGIKNINKYIELNNLELRLN